MLFATAAHKLSFNGLAFYMIQMQNDSCKAPDTQQQYSIKVTLHFVVRQ